MSSGTLTHREATRTTTGASRSATTDTRTTKAGARARATSRRTPAPGAKRARTTTAPIPETTGGTAPFVLLIMVLLTSGLVATLWLSTAAAADSYRLEDARQTTRDRSEEVERLHRDVAAMQAAPALAASAERIGMVPAGVPAVILVHPDGTSQVVGSPQKARAAAPPPQPAPAPQPAQPAQTTQPAQPTQPGSTSQDARSQGDPEGLAANPSTGVQAASGGSPAPAPAGAGTTSGGTR
ncbi:hypothetical protein [Actinomycetospora termitidis]|uniref:Cell division protein FtsL n=1 Tax=Actinomycetospora termitidis TaxID=3053470 RepID=A0ABT7M879_9PSEU|nr:hypothetical protein [Actinomycetospora sp. Odt1-22]MDL5156878.1 hypothetical protein [Actinomycetospora sp. Odt1-22]